MAFIGFARFTGTLRVAPRRAVIGDPAWPGPVWGHSPAVPYRPLDRQARLDLVSSG